MLFITLSKIKQLSWRVTLHFTCYTIEINYDTEFQYYHKIKKANW